MPLLKANMCTAESLAEALTLLPQTGACLALFMYDMMYDCRCAVSLS